MITIELRNARFFAFHGLYDEEKVKGNEFEVNLAVTQKAKKTIRHIDDTVNYVDLFEIVKEEMAKPRKLIETLAMEIAEIIHEKFPAIKEINISIAKLQPPIPEYTGSVMVSYRKKF